MVTRMPRLRVILVVLGLIGLCALILNVSTVSKYRASFARYFPTMDTEDLKTYPRISTEVNDKYVHFLQGRGEESNHTCIYTQKTGVKMDMITELKTTKHIWYPETEQMVKKYCPMRKWDDMGPLPTIGVVVTFGDHESIYNVLHTVHALVERTPADLLKEIIVVDDNSTKDEHKDLLSNYMKLAFGNLIKIHRSVKPLGLIRARKTGGLLVTADVIAFFDSHQEVQPGWAEPLLYEIKKNPKTLAAGCLDWMEKKGAHWEYIHGPISWVVIFDWNFDFQFQDIGTDKVVKRKVSTDAFSTPIMMGNTYAIGREWFIHIGTFDEGMEFWGGENIDLSLRTWLCGGQITMSPCSRASHLEGGNLRGYRSARPDYAPSNYKRVAEVWLDSYKSLFYRFKPDLMKKDVGDLKERQALRRKCPRSFQWYLDNAYPYIGVPWLNTLAYNGLRSMKYRGCLDTLQTRFAQLWDSCNVNSHPEGFFWTKELNMRFPLHIFNADSMRSHGRDDRGLIFSEFIVYYNSTIKRSTFMHWKAGPFIEIETMQCLEAVTDRDVGFRPCKAISEQYWSFAEYSAAYEDMISGALGSEQVHSLYKDIKDKYSKLIVTNQRRIAPTQQVKTRAVASDSSAHAAILDKPS